MNVRLLSNGNGYAQLFDVLPIVHPLWGADYSKLGVPADISVRVLGKAQGNAACVGRVRTQRDGDTPVGEGAVSDWPGRGHGVRPPYETETCLSWQEVMHGIKEGLI